MAPELRTATDADADAVARVVDAAYRGYIPRLGRPPRPMTEDYAEVLAKLDVTVAIAGGEIVGVVVLGERDEGFLVENVAVDPAHQGRGAGRALLLHAEDEARRAGHGSIYLFTHERMTENIELYSRIGYAEFDRRVHGDATLVFMRKQLGSR